MEISFIRAIASDEHLKWFAMKAYGLELMFLIEQSEATNSENGIDDTWLLIEHNRPQKGTFSLYINQLVNTGTIITPQSKVKRSKKILRLSDASQIALAQARKST